MKNVSQIVRVLAAVLIGATLISSLAQAQQTNPNKLPPCPKPNYLIKTEDVNLHANFRAPTMKWHNCWGVYKYQKNEYYKNTLRKGEWRNGVLDGYGTENSLGYGHFYEGGWKEGNFHGKGTMVTSGETYIGEWVDGVPNGNVIAKFDIGDEYRGRWSSYVTQGGFGDSGVYTHKDGTKIFAERNSDDCSRCLVGKMIFTNGDMYEGQISENILLATGVNRLVMGGEGVLTKANGKVYEGVWENNKLILAAKVNLPSQNNNISINTDRTEIERERQQFAEERRRLEEEKRQREQQRRSERINLQVTHTQPNIDGIFTINVQINADTASLKINGEEQGGHATGDYIAKKVARAGQETKFTIVATDINGNTDTKSITVSRPIVDSKVTYTALNPGQVKQQSAPDAVAIIIGIADYKSLPKADFANDDARAFYDYAIRALGIKPENIKLLVDADAEEIEILRTFRNWLPSKVRSTTDAYVFYSGHGLPTADGQGLYLIPPRAAKDLIDDTAIPFSKINAALQSAKPKSVTMILDACYSGQARSGETLVASARPVTLKTENRLFPENFTVITASQNDQISSSNPDLQHGIFSYYLMKGMEGDADANRDGKITLGEMQAYLVENVGRQAGMMNRKQEPQLVGDANRVLVGR